MSSSKSYYSKQHTLFITTTITGEYISKTILKQFRTIHCPYTLCTQYRINLWWPSWKSIKLCILNQTDMPDYIQNPSKQIFNSDAGINALSHKGIFYKTADWKINTWVAIPNAKLRERCLPFDHVPRISWCIDVKHERQSYQRDYQREVSMSRTWERRHACLQRLKLCGRGIV